MSDSPSSADPGVVGLKSSPADIVRNREDFTKRPVDSDEEYAEYLKKARAHAADPLRVPKYLLKALLGIWTASKLVTTVLTFVFPKNGPLVSRMVKLLGVAAVVRRFGAPSKVNSHLPEAVPSLPIIGALPFLLKDQDDMHGFILNALRKVNFKTIELRLPGVHMILLMDPRDREYMLRTHFSNFTKNLPKEGNSFEFCFAELFGRGIFAVDGAEWKDHRKIASHLFTSNSLKLKMEKVFNKHGNILKATLQRHAERNETIDIQNHMQALVFDAFCEIAFGISPGAFDLAIEGKKLDFLVSFDLVQMYTAERLFLPPLQWEMLRFFGLGHQNEVAKHVAVMRNYIIPIVQTRKASMVASEGTAKPEGDGQDMLSLYIAHAKELNQLYMLDDDYLYEVVANFMVAGRDTTSCSMTNFFRFASTNPQAEETLLKELHEKAPLVIAGADVTLDLTRELNYASSCVNEALRLLPPVCDDFRFANEDAILPSGIKVTKGMQVGNPSLAIGRDPSLWHDPESFIPERWMINANRPGGVRRPDEFMLSVFWGGHRLCLGHAMARFEMITFIAKVCPSFQLTPLPNQPFKLITGPVGFYRDGMLVKVNKRQ